MYNSVGEVLAKSPAILDKLLKYSGCEEFIRKVGRTYNLRTCCAFIACVLIMWHALFRLLQHPVPRLRMRRGRLYSLQSINCNSSMTSLSSLVSGDVSCGSHQFGCATCRGIFYSSSVAEQCFPKLLVVLCSNDPRQKLSSMQALAKQLADIFDFVLRFDDAKVITTTQLVCCRDFAFVLYHALSKPL